MADFLKLLGGITSAVAGARTIRGYLDERKSERQQQVSASPIGQDLAITNHRVRNIDDRIAYIRGQLLKGREHPKVRMIATKILTKRCGNSWCVPEKNWEAEVDAVFRSVRSRVRYTRDFVHKDLFQHPHRTLQLRAGDCDDYTSLLGALLQAVGYPVKMRVIQTTNSNSWDHIYLVVGLPPDNPTRWKPLDASVNKPPGWEAPRSMVKRKRDYTV